MAGRLLSSFMLTFVVILGATTPAAARSTEAIAELPSVFVRVVDATTDLPVAGAEVVITFVEGDPDHPIITGQVYNATTNGGGHVLFKGLQAGGYVVSISADGYVKFGDGGDGKRLPTGLNVFVGSFRHGAGASGNVGVRVVVDLVPLTCADCRTA
jgi:carboxypeptidase family protein/type VI secretion system (T6SS) baseplate-like injector VgrG